MEELLIYFSRVASANGWPLPAGCLDYLRHTLKKCTLKAGEHLVREGEVSRNQYFITKGLLKSYYILDKEVVSGWFFSDKERMVIIESFFEQAPSGKGIQALEDCELLYLSQEEENYAYDNFVEFNVIGRVLPGKYIENQQQLVRIVMSSTEEERYLFLQKHYPHWLKRASLRDLASLLNMKPITMSRIRAQLRGESIG